LMLSCRVSSSRMAAASLMRSRSSHSRTLKPAG
jgi:hypothetical protein